MAVDRVGLEGVWQQRLQQREAEKRRIAKKAASLIDDGQVVILDTGSTVFHVVDFLSGKAGLTLITNFPPLLSRLTQRDDWKAIMVGGTLRPGRYDLVGPLAERALEDISADVALLGADGLTRRGAGSNDEQICRVADLMASAAQTRIVLADASKIGSRATFRYAPWDRIDRVVTDKAAEPAFVRWLRSRHVTVDLA